MKDAPEGTPDEHQDELPPQDEPKPKEAGILDHKTTPKARRLIRTGLEEIKSIYTKGKKQAELLQDQAVLHANKQGEDYIADLLGEFTEPGSDEARERDQLALEGFEGPYRKELADMEGRP